MCGSRPVWHGSCWAVTTTDIRGSPLLDRRFNVVEAEKPKGDALSSAMSGEFAFEPRLARYNGDQIQVLGFLMCWPTEATARSSKRSSDPQSSTSPFCLPKVWPAAQVLAQAAAAYGLRAQGGRRRLHAFCV